MIERLDVETRRPTFLSGDPLRDGWQAIRAIGHRAAEHQSVVLLSLVYTLVVIPTAVIARIADKDLLSRQIVRQTGTGWRPRPAVSVDQRLY